MSDEIYNIIDELANLDENNISSLHVYSLIMRARNTRSNRIRPECESQLNNFFFSDEEWSEILEDQKRRAMTKWLDL